MFGLSPWLLGGAAVAALLAFGGGYIRGDSDAANRYQVKIDKMQIDAAAQVQKTRDALMAQADSAVTSLETKNAASRVIYRTITQQVDKIVERPVYRNVCLDDAGLMLVNAALAGVAVAPPNPGDTHPGLSAPLTPR